MRPFLCRVRHGLSHTVTHNAWCSMKNRCSNKNCPDYRYYGGRGITFCEQWESFDTFFKDMGLCPKGYTLERVEVNKNYTPSNCCWIPKRAQFRNRRSCQYFKYRGVTRCLTEWAEIVGLKQHTLRKRLIVHRWSMEKALMTPARKKAT